MITLHPHSIMTAVWWNVDGVLVDDNGYGPVNNICKLVSSWNFLLKAV